MRCANNPEPWEAHEVMYLVSHAGSQSVDFMAEWLGKTTEQVDNAAFLMGLDTRMSDDDLFWCHECCKWRTKMEKRSGVCHTCSLKRRLDITQQELLEVLAKMPQELRSIYEKSESTLMPRPVEPRPKAPEKSDKASQRAYLIALEQWELKTTKRAYDATRQRLRRMRSKHEPSNP